MKESYHCLNQAIHGEMEAVTRYTAFATQADQEQFPNIGRLFRLLAEAEKIHIANHSNALNGHYEAPIAVEAPEISNTLTHLQDSIAGEMEENRQMYPRFVKTIKKDFPAIEAKVALLSVQWAGKAEKVHAKLLSEALKAVKSGKDLASGDFYLCRVCGNIELGKPEAACFICGHDEQFFIDAKTAIHEKTNREHSL